MKDFSFQNPYVPKVPGKVVNLSLPLLILILFLNCSLSCLFSQSQTLFYRLWTQASSKVNPEFTNHVVSTVNSANQTYVAGSSLNTSNTHSLLLTKYLSNGTESWHTSFTVNTDGDVYVGAITLDGTGNVLLTGSAYNGSTNNYDLFVVKFNTSGTKLWHVLYNGAGNSYDSGSAIICGSNNEVFVTGAAWTSSTNIDAVTIGYNSSGTVLWTQTFNNASLVDVGGTIAISGSEVIVTGFTQTSVSNWEFLGLSYWKSNGSFNGSKITSSGGSTIDRINSAAVDASGNIYITGAIGGSGTGLNVKTVKLDPSLNIVWTVTWNGSANQDDTGRRISVDASGNVFIAGYTTLNGNRNALLLKYTSTGTLSFANTYDGTEGNDEFADLALSGSGDVFVGGYTTKKGNKDFYAAYYSNSGTLRWAESYNGPLNGNDEIQQVIADGSNGFIVAGPSVGLLGSGSATVTATARTIKYALHNLIMPTNEAVNAPFIENRGQVINTDGTSENNVRFYARNTYPNLYFSNNSISYVYAHIDTIPSSQDTMVRLDLSFPTRYTRPNVASGLEEQNYQYNYYLGHIPEGRERVPLDNKVLFPDLYPNIDALFGQGRDGLFMRFSCKAGSTPSDISLEFNGKTAASILSNGSLKIETILEDLILPQPTALTISAEGTETPITNWNPTYSIGSDGKISITTGSYNTTNTLIIKVGRDRGDLGNACNYWSTYYGDNGNDVALGSDVGSNGKMYFTGSTQSTQFPTSAGAYQDQLIGSVDAIITCFEQPDKLFWSTYYGGNDNSGIRIEEGVAIKFNAVNDNVYVVGRTSSEDFPKFNPGSGYFSPDILSNAVSRGFILKFNSLKGTRNWATFFGDQNCTSDGVTALEVLENGNIAVGGYAWNLASGTNFAFPALAPSPKHTQTNGDNYIAEFNSDNVLLWATRLVSPPQNSGLHGNQISDIAEDRTTHNILLTGLIFGQGDSNIPFGTPTYGYTDNGDLRYDAFIMRFAENRSLAWSTYFGGYNTERTNSIVALGNGDFVISGSTNSTQNQSFPVLQFGNSTSDLVNDLSYNGGSSDIFIAKFGNNNALKWCRYLGGPGGDGQGQIEVYGNNLSGVGNSMASSGNTVYLTGYVSNDFAPLQGNNCEHFYDVINGFSSTSDPGYVSTGYDVVITIIDDQNVINFNTYWGGSRDVNNVISDFGMTISTGTNPINNKFFVLFGGKTRSLSSGLNNTIPVCHESTTPPFYFNPDLVNTPELYDGFISKIYLDDCLVVGTNTVADDVELFQIAPNPAAADIRLLLDPEKEKPASIRVYDISGRDCTGLTNLPASSAPTTASIDIHRLPAGLYHVRVQYAEKVFIGRFVKI